LARRADLGLAGGRVVLELHPRPTWHIAIRVELRSGHMDDDWRVEATVMAEAGQLEAIGHRAASFFGREA